jgi:hypothetical protein
MRGMVYRAKEMKVGRGRPVFPENGGRRRHFLHLFAALTAVVAAVAVLRSGIIVKLKWKKDKYLFTD